MRFDARCHASAVVCTALFLSGCGSDSDDPGSGGGNLKPPAIGIQLESGSYLLESGVEEYQCWSFQVPEDEPIALVELEHQIPVDGVHHYAVFTRSTPFDPDASGPYECFSMGADWGLVTGGGLGTPGVKFPEGTSMNIPGGQHLVLQLHLLNATQSTLDVQPARINLVGAANPEALVPVGLLIAGTLNIQIPPHSSDVSATGSCTLDAPLENIFAVFPHMHQLGRRIRAEITPAGGEPRMLIDNAWDFGDQGLFMVEGSANAGDQVKVTCAYDNPGAEPVGFGLGSSDEMCVEVLYHYPASGQQYCGIP